jgi:hypothetical protein
MPDPFNPQNVQWLFCPHQHPRDVSTKSPGVIRSANSDDANAEKKSVKSGIGERSIRANAARGTGNLPRS